MSMTNPKPVTPSTPKGAQFATNPSANIQRSRFDYSSRRSQSQDAGYLCPIYVDEVLPGDTWAVKTSIVARLTSMLVPIMDDVFIDYHWWFVPHRLVWTHLVNMFGEQANPGDSIAYTVPQFACPAGGFAVHSLFDYLEYKTTPLVGGGSGTYNVNSLESRAYNLIYNTWYRDQNLIDSAVQNTGDSGDVYTDFPLQRRGKRHDYLTSMAPFLQKGVAASIPLGGSLPVSGTAPVQGSFDTPPSGQTLDQFQTTLTGTTGTKSASLDFEYTTAPGGTAGTFQIDMTANANIGSLVADLSSATTVTINALRLAVTMQQYLELNARGGTRFTELILAHYGVVNPDFRLQRPEYLGGGSFPFGIYSTPQTAPATDTPASSLTAWGIATHPGNSLVHSFTEFGTIMCIASVRARYTYSQGTPRRTQRQTRFDFYAPIFAMLGEQAVLTMEATTTGTSTDQVVLGYQERWAEYRTKLSSLCGLMRPDAVDSLAIWNLGQDFSSALVFNQDFIEENPPFDRITATQEVDQPNVKLDAEFKCGVVRPMPIRSIPGLLRL